VKEERRRDNAGMPVVALCTDVTIWWNMVNRASLRISAE